MYRTSSSSCSYEDHETINSNSNSNSNPSMYIDISIQHPSMASSFLMPSPPSYSSPLLLNPNSYSSTNNGYLHRSNSSHSLPIYHNHCLRGSVNTPTSTPIFSSSSPSLSACREILDFNSMPMRRVFSTGDLQVIRVITLIN
jgi:hypothetical protein